MCFCSAASEKPNKPFREGAAAVGTSLAGSPPSLSTTLPPQGSVPTYLPLHFGSPGSFPPRPEVEENGIVLPYAGLSCPAAAAAAAAATIAAGGAAAAAEPCPARAVPLAGRKPHPSPAAWQVSLYRWTLIAFLVAEASRERA